MKTVQTSKSLALTLCAGLIFSPLRATAQDIDIFVGSSAGAAGNPNVLIVLDNTSNWSRQSQKWPGGEQQGQSEVDSIKTVIQTLNAQTNVGLMEFVTGSGANNNGGFIRYAINPMSGANQTSFSTQLTNIYNAITDPNEKRNSNTPYGNLMYDVYNYYAGANQSQAGAATVASIADSNGYTSTYGTFKSPLSCGTSCAKNFIIFISNPNASGPASDDATNTAALSVLGGNTSQLGLPNFTTSEVPVSTTLGTTTQCLSAATCTAAAGTTANNAAFVTANAPSLATTCADTSTYSYGCSCGTAQAGTPNCAAGTQRYSVIKTLSAGSVVSTWTTRDTYASVATPGTTAPLHFPTTSGPTAETSSCPAGTTTYFSDKVASGPKYIYTVQCKQAADSTSNLGYTSSCYASQADCSTADYTAQCTSPATCACSSPTITTGTSCGSGTSLYSVLGNNAQIVNTPTGTYTTDANPFNADEWARFLYQKGIPIAGCTSQTVTTYTIDVYNAQPNAQNTALMMSMAKNGGGKYFNATNKSALVNALKQIFEEIQSVNSTFASASLPVNATNRAQNENQVFIGMFRPDPDAKPRWFGNMKRYQLIQSGGDTQLGDVNGLAAVNTLTGFLTSCATSWWTTNSGTYWSTVPTNPSPAGTCPTTSYDPFSDSPDGPRVEKGAIAEVLRKGNTPPYSDTPAARPWAVNRTVYTLSGGALTAFDTSSSGLSSSIVDFTLGKDVNDEDSNGNTTETRPSIHGDVIHSRPLPVNYGGTTGVTVYYGANDGTFRAINAANGQELWAFVAPEFFSSLSRLSSNSPLVNYPNVSTSITPTPAPKDFFFDGSIGIYQNSDNSKVWIYPTMRRGGRMIYGFNVTNPILPAYKWKVGCPNLADDNGCTSGASGFGQTWSLPNVAFIKGNSTSTPVIVVGGGYDACEDTDSSSPSCSSPKGAGVHIIDADSGTIIKSFNTTRSVAADVSLVDVDGDGYVDYGYAADTGGNIYRIKFAGAPTSWTITRVAYTNGGGRKFLFGPALLPTAGGKIFLAIGSGDREHPLQTNYPYTSVTNRFYVYIDNLAATSATNLDVAGEEMKNFTSTTTCSTSGVWTTDSDEGGGWFMDLNQYGQGEQTVTSAVIAGGMVTFSTNRPIPAAAGSCSTALGEARGYWLNLLNASGAISAPGNASCGGSRSAPFVGGGLPPSPVLGIVPIAGKPTTVVIGAVQRSGGASSPVSPQNITPTISGKRRIIYWKSSGDN